jgi:predicted RNA-binding protein with PUA-like domain
LDYWLLKTEPGAYSLDDLAREGKTVWDGVTNPAALKNLRTMGSGDHVLVYHSGAHPAVVGLAKVAGRAYPDPKAGDPKLVVIDIRFVGRLPRPVALAELKAEKVFADSPLLRQGRLSVVPLTEEQWGTILERAGV